MQNIDGEQKYYGSQPARPRRQVIIGKIKPWCKNVKNWNKHSNRIKGQQNNITRRLVFMNEIRFPDFGCSQLPDD
jgi:hypothetical protein